MQISKALIKDYTALYGELPLPVVVCSGAPLYRVLYANMEAALMFYPSYSAELPAGSGAPDISLADILGMDTRVEYEQFTSILATSGRIESYPGNAITFEGGAKPVQLYGNTVHSGGQVNHVLYFVPAGKAAGGQASYDSRLATIVSSTIMEDPDDAINAVLALAGNLMGVSRAYIFEEISPTTTANTYEWCAEGVEPAIQDLQNLDKEDYPYDVIIESRMFIVNDVHNSDIFGREILEMQGIKAVAIISMYDHQTPLGYVGFDDTTAIREWSGDEVTFLKNISTFLGALMKRRNADASLRNSKNVLQIITDNTQDLVYANRLDDYSLVFVSRSLMNLLEKSEEELLGKPCWQMFQKEQDGPCPFCPMPHIHYNAEEDRSDTYNWEHDNKLVGRVYIAQDSIVRWVDGQLVHMEVATDITDRSRYEEELKTLASIDLMTGVYNREFGTLTLEQRLKNAKAGGCLCFIDLDGLKKANDTYGHAAGDDFIIETLRLLKEEADRGDFVCRWGGDEFLIWMERGKKQAEEAMRRATEAVDAYNATSGKPYKLGFSYGVADYRPDEDDLDSLVKRADGLMYKNKMEKRGLRRRKEDH